MSSYLLRAAWKPVPLLISWRGHSAGHTHSGRHYGLAKKREVALAFMQLWEENATFCPPVVWVAKRAKVGWHYSDLVIKELRDNGESLANLIKQEIIRHKTAASTAASFCQRQKFSYSPCGQKTGEGPTYHTFMSYSLPTEGLFLVRLYPFGSIRGLGTVAGPRQRKMYRNWRLYYCLLQSLASHTSLGEQRHCPYQESRDQRDYA